MLAVAEKVEMTELPVPAAERTFSVPLAATWITPYGPEGAPGRIAPGAAVGKMTPGSAVEPAGAGVTAGRTRAEGAVGRPTAGNAEDGVASDAMGVDREMGVGRGAGALSRESEQALRASVARQAAKRIKVRFISLSF